MDKVLWQLKGKALVLFGQLFIVHSGVYRTQNATEILPDDYMDYELEDYIDEMFRFLINEYFYYPQEKKVLWMDIAHG